MVSFLEHFIQVTPFNGFLRRLWNEGKIPRSFHFTFQSVLPDGNVLMFKWPSQVNTIIKDIYEYSAYDRLWKVQKGFTVMDVGAHIGVYTLKTAKRIGHEGHIVSVEPEEENFRLLCRNIRANKYKNVTTVNAALSDFEGRASLYLASIGSGEHSMLQLSKKKVEIPVQTVDSLTQRLGIESVDLMKIDVEGTEVQVLKGSTEMLREHRIHRMTIAAYHYPSEGTVLRELLARFGYTITTLDLEIGRYLYAEY